MIEPVNVEHCTHARSGEKYDKSQKTATHTLSLQSCVRLRRSDSESETQSRAMIHDTDPKKSCY